MTITITRTKFAIAVIAVSLLIPATAFATHVFSDVPDDRFYSEAVEWAFDNGITTGTSATTFAPDAGVTRGQNVTFAKRYDDNIVQPALATLEDDIATNADDVADLASTTCSGTVMGFRVYDHSAVVDNEDWFVDVQLPCEASAPLTDETVNFHTNALADDSDATCTGTAEEPTAPFGKVCIYLESSSGVDGLVGYDSLISGPNFDRQGFSIAGNADASPGDDTYARMTWAYTPPLTFVIIPLDADADADPGSDGK